MSINFYEQLQQIREKAIIRENEKFNKKLVEILESQISSINYENIKNNFCDLVNENPYCESFCRNIYLDIDELFTDYLQDSKYSLIFISDDNYLLKYNCIKKEKQHTYELFIKYICEQQPYIQNLLNILSEKFSGLETKTVNVNILPNQNVTITISLYYNVKLTNSINIPRISLDQ